MMMVGRVSWYSACLDHEIGLGVKRRQIMEKEHDNRDFGQLVRGGGLRTISSLSSGQVTRGLGERGTFLASSSHEQLSCF